MKRPRIITIICIIGYFTTLITFPQVFSPSIKKIGLLVPALYGIIVAAHFISCVGLWYYKRWGASMFLLAFFAKTLFFMSIRDYGAGFYIHLTLSAFFIFIILRHYSKMSQNL